MLVRSQQVYMADDPVPLSCWSVLWHYRVRIFWLYYRSKHTDLHASTVRTMLSENSTFKTQARAFSLFAFAGNVGIFLGPVIGMH